MTERTQEFREKYGRKPENGGTFTFKHSAHKEPEKPAYKAFSTQRQRQNNLWIRPNGANDETDLSIPYIYHKTMITDGGGFHISIFVADDSIQQIEIQGRYLGPLKGEAALNDDGDERDSQDLWRNLLKGYVIWIREFDARIYASPADGEPVITAIKVHRKAVAEKSEEELLPGERKIAGTTRDRTRKLLRADCVQLHWTQRSNPNGSRRMKLPPTSKSKSAHCSCGYAWAECPPMRFRAPRGASGASARMIWTLTCSAI
ncbi:MAG TPA: hypothetical protein VGL74_03320 [Terriglobales bacterium]|jgi:hypothetical protein